MSRTKTQHYKSLVDPVKATALYNHLATSIRWEEGVRSKNGFTRLAKAVNLNDDPRVDEMIVEVLVKLGYNGYLGGIYLNYYKDGQHYTPNHSHKGTQQIIISLGATRTLTIGKTDYAMANGDVAIFGSSVHGIKKEPLVADGRISIALFVTKN
ncbi:Hypothetical protein POVR1_LOCUS57 [uncultured virus]|nr:Hypothetical protein POVR1_LOCUS57 [uncultured virus]